MNCYGISKQFGRICFLKGALRWYLWRLINWLIDWWSIDWWSIDWLFHRLIHWLINWSIDWLIDCFGYLNNSILKSVFFRLNRGYDFPNLVAQIITPASGILPRLNPKLQFWNEIFGFKKTLRSFRPVFSFKMVLEAKCCLFSNKTVLVKRISVTTLLGCFLHAHHALSKKAFQKRPKPRMISFLNDFHCVFLLGFLNLFSTIFFHIFFHIFFTFKKK